MWSKTERSQDLCSRGIWDRPALTADLEKHTGNKAKEVEYTQLMTFYSKGIWAQ